MDPVLVVILIMVAIVVGVVWAVVMVVSLLVRAAWWGVSLPFRLVARSLPAEVKPPRLTQRVGRARCGNEKCGGPLPERARFCPRCGSAVNAQQQAITMSIAGMAG